MIAQTIHGILADMDVQGHVEVLVQLMQSGWMREIWTDLNLSVFTFADLGLATNVSDAILWHACQSRQAVLLTRNRNADGPESLQRTVEAHSQPDSLPVFTLASADRILAKGAYAEQVAERFLEYLTEIDNVRGTGRIWLP